MSKKLKVVVVGTGNVGSIAIRCLKGREDMELVGAFDIRITTVTNSIQIACYLSHSSDFYY